MHGRQVFESAPKPNASSLLNIVLYQPVIAPNTGNIMRLCANSGCHLHLIGPLGFSIDDKQLRRAGMDYRERISFTHWPKYEGFASQFSPQRMVTLSTRNSTCYSDFAYSSQDVIVFGSEIAGLPDSLRQLVPVSRQLRLPMCKGSRSLNLANAVAIVIYEAWRQLGFDGAVKNSDTDCRNNKADTDSSRPAP